MRMLDLFCCGGGGAIGYSQAGFDEIIGVDMVMKRDYPFEQIKGDCLEIIKDLDFLRTFDFIHSSPVCRGHSITGNLAIAQGNKKCEINQIPAVREALIESGVSFVIENVVGSPLEGIILCGSMFDLKVRRHRIFESNIPLSLNGLKCNHKAQGRPIGVYGTKGDEIPQGGKTAVDDEEARMAMGIKHLNWGDLTQAIPPAYTRFIGEQIIEYLELI